MISLINPINNTVLVLFVRFVHCSVKFWTLLIKDHSVANSHQTTSQMYQTDRCVEGTGSK